MMIRKMARGAQEKDLQVQIEALKSQYLYLAGETSRKCHMFIRQYFQVWTFRCPEKRMAVLRQLIKSFFDYRKEITASHLCGRILARGTHAFKCLNCMLEENSIICVECFQKSDHRGHKFEKIVVAGGCCDCGDSEKWDGQGFCHEHNQQQLEYTVNQSQLKKFVEETQFIYYMIFSSYFSLKPQTPYFIIASKQLASCFLDQIKKFNTRSIPSNIMTAQLMSTQYRDIYSDICCQSGKAVKVKGETVLNLSLRVLNNKEFASSTVQIWTMLFSAPGFKKQLTRLFPHKIIHQPMLLQTDFSSIVCQIFTSHQTIQELIHETSFQPLHLLYLPKTLKFQAVTSIYYNLFIFLAYLSRLSKGTNRIALRNQFLHGNVCHLFGYATSACKDSDSISYYGIEFIYITYMFNMVQAIKDDKQLLLKMIKDVLEHLHSSQDCQDVYLTQQRTLLLCIFAYFDGDLSKAVETKFLLKILGTKDTESQLSSLINRLASIIKTYSLSLSNPQFNSRFNTFYSFIFIRVSYLVSLDLLLFKVCVAAYSEVTDRPLFELLSQPFREVVEIFRSPNLNTNQDEVYDRQKAISLLAEYIGLLRQTFTVDYHDIMIKSALKVVTEQEAIQVYGGLLVSIGTASIEQFKHIGVAFLGETLPSFEKFIEQHVQLQGKRLSVKPTSQKLFSKFHFSKSRSFEPLNEQNAKVAQLSDKPPNTEHLAQTFTQFFMDRFQQQTLKIANAYLQILLLDENVLKTDIYGFSALIQELLRVYQVTYSAQLQNFIENLCKKSQIMQQMTKKLEVMINVCVGNKDYLFQESQNNGNVELSRKNLTKKMQKIRSKQKKVMQLFLSEYKMQQESKDSDESQLCMVCHNGGLHTSEFGVLCFIHSSNLFAKNFMNSSRESFMVMTCNHYLHVDCYNQFFANRQYIYCTLCKSPSNLLLLTTNHQPQKSKQGREEDLEHSPGNAQFQTVVGRQGVVKCLERVNVAMALTEQPDQEEQEEKQAQKVQLSVNEKVIDTLTMSILYGATINTHMFLRNSSRACHYLLMALKSEKLHLNSLFKLVELQCSHNTHNEQSISMWNAYKTIVQTILQLCEAKQVSNSAWDASYLRQLMPKQLSHKITTIMQHINNQSEALSFAEKALDFEENHHFAIRQLPEQLEELASEIGACKQCNRKTNEICICMLCEFRSCMSCQNCDLTTHTHQVHAGQSVFVRVDNGCYIYIGGKKAWKFESLYLNILHEEFSLDKKERSKFRLSRDKLAKISKDICEFRIEQEIRYMEFRTHKSMNFQP